MRAHLPSVLPNLRFFGKTLDAPIFFEEMNLRRAREGFAKKRIAPVFGKTLPEAPNRLLPARLLGRGCPKNGMRSACRSIAIWNGS